jgi:hypothetical protein
MHNVQRIEKGAHSRVGAPHRDQKSDQERDGQGTDMVFGERQDVLLQEVDNTGWNDARQDS